jgi:hypothetical protein
VSLLCAENSTKENTWKARKGAKNGIAMREDNPPVKDGEENKFSTTFEKQQDKHAL